MLPEDVWQVIWRKYFDLNVIPQIKQINKLLNVNETYRHIIILTFESPVGYINYDNIWQMGKSIWPNDVGWVSFHICSNIGQPYYTIRYNERCKKCETIETTENIMNSSFTKSLKTIMIQNITS